MSQFSFANRYIHKDLGQFLFSKQKKTIDYYERKYLLFCEYKFKFKKKIPSETLREC